MIEHTFPAVRVECSKKMGWFTWLFLAFCLWVLHAGVTAIQVKVVAGKNDMAIFGHSFLNYTDMNMNGCIAKCMDNCLCSSFQTCDGKCQLCNSSRYESPFAYRKKRKCTNFEIKKTQEQSFGNYAPAVNCCITSNPCLNGGKCKPIVDPTQLGRFRCTCARGYDGKLCQNKLLKSCRRWYHESREPGVYTISDEGDAELPVFCDFDHDTQTVWTLVQSYAFGERVAFQRHPYFVDKPYNNKTPSWDNYRLSYGQMKLIMDDSTKWRITCDYDKDGVVYTDYVTGSNAQVDILGPVHSECVVVEYINVRQFSCANCSTVFIQTYDQILHVDSYNDYGCDFTLGEEANSEYCIVCGDTDGTFGCNDAAGENNFGFYVCVNHLHRCSNNSESTTQTWFGYKYNGPK